MPAEPAIVLDQVSVRYAGAPRPSLRDVSLEVPEGELVLVVGRTGSGKSTLLGAIGGGVPHFTGGTLSGRVLVGGRDTRDNRPRDLADVVGVVGQDPLAGFVTDTVEEELAYGMEQLGLPAAVMRKRVEETLDVLGIAELRGAALRELSGGQQQRVAIGSVLTTHARILILDEPTSALDPTGAEEVLAAVTRLVHDLGVTVLVAEHRVERVVQYADRMIHVSPSGEVVCGPPAEVMRVSDIAPPVVELGRWAGWEPLPLSVRDARRAGQGLRVALHSTLGPQGWHDALTSDLRVTPGAAPDAVAASASDGAEPMASSASSVGAASPRPARRPGLLGRLTHSGREAHAREAAMKETAALVAERMVVRHGPVVAVADVGVTLAPGEITGLMGRNGAGKSSLLWAVQGSGTRTSGRVTVRDRDGRPHDTATLDAAERRRLVGLVPQTASDMLYLDSVTAECEQADRESGAAPGTCRGLLDRLAPGIPGEQHPRDLSEGQKLALVLAVQLTSDPPVLLLDEPTRGLDYPAKAALTTALKELAARGVAILLSTHDVEFVAETAGRVIVMAAGEVVADGPTADVVVSSPSFAPQVAKITAPGPWLTVDDVRRALGDTPPTEGGDDHR